MANVPSFSVLAGCPASCCRAARSSPPEPRDEPDRPRLHPSPQPLALEQASGEAGSLLGDVLGGRGPPVRAIGTRCYAQEEGEKEEARRCARRVKIPVQEHVDEASRKEYPEGGVDEDRDCNQRETYPLGI